LARAPMETSGTAPQAEVTSVSLGPSHHPNVDMPPTGLSIKIRNAYSFLSHNYNFEKRHDEIILAGFSRGAFTVQCLASFISQTGLLEKQHLYYLGGLFTLWENQELPGARDRLNEEVKKLKDNGLLRDVTITALAVWDTVAAYGTWTKLLPKIGTTVPYSVRNAFHAISLDEQRLSFQPVIWRSFDPKPPRRTDDPDPGQSGPPGPRVSHCWFLGVHADVGGNRDAALGAVTLCWMIAKLQDKVGVAFDEYQIKKHLKHRFLEWGFTVNTFRKRLDETNKLSELPHTGEMPCSSLFICPSWLCYFLSCQGQELTSSFQARRASKTGSGFS
jgi:uncharacterized protein (DUF2235 family)